MSRTVSLLDDLKHARDEVVNLRAELRREQDQARREIVNAMRAIEGGLREQVEQPGELAEGEA
jgi:hypothetical protein